MGQTIQQRQLKVLEACDRAKAAHADRMTHEQALSVDHALEDAQTLIGGLRASTSCYFRRAANYHALAETEPCDPMCSRREFADRLRQVAARLAAEAVRLS